MLKRKKHPPPQEENVRTRGLVLKVGFMLCPFNLEQFAQVIALVFVASSLSTLLKRRIPASIEKNTIAGVVICQPKVA